MKLYKTTEKITVEKINFFFFFHSLKAFFFEKMFDNSLSLTRVAVVNEVKIHVVSPIR